MEEWSRHFFFLLSFFRIFATNLLNDGNYELQKSFIVNENCRRIARGAFEGAAYLQELYLPETVSFIGEDAFAGCISLQGIYYGETTPSDVSAIERHHSDGDAEEVARYNLSGRSCHPSDKGVQIIVYSDFTTKTIIVE